jgi:hypothetical protein
MEDATNEEKLSKALDTLEVIDATLLKLYAKTASSTSFGDQSLTLTSIKDLEESRDKYRVEIQQLKQAVAGSRKTLKIQFR